MSSREGSPADSRSAPADRIPGGTNVRRCWQNPTWEVVFLRIEVLGPLRVIGDGITEPHRASHRRLLAILALEKGRRVGTERLIDMFWGENPPTKAKASLQTHISALRRLLEPGLIQTEGYGYRLSFDDIEMDAVVLEQEAASARMEAVNHSWEAAWQAAERGLSQWRGSPYPELSDDDFARPEIARLEETHLGLWELWAESLLASGRPAEALPELERLVLEHPYRERLWEHLMTARYALGRNAEALRAFRKLSDHLAEIGLEPGPSMSRLEEKILLHERDLAAPPHNLPIEPTSFVGRDVEVVEVAGLLADHGLVTLTGPAGSGKTRLATEVAAAQVASFPGGAWFVGLADLRDPDLIPLEILRVLGIRPGSPDPLEDAVTAMRHETVLLVLDNCEHLGEGASNVVRRLMAGGRGIRVLATSREPLHAPGEVAYELLPLSVPPESVTTTEVSRFDAVRLFLDRASAADPRVRFDLDDLLAAARVCQRLDGLPLAIELAAAKTRSFSVGTLDRLLREDFSAAADPRPGGAGSRHSSVDASIAWSFDLLDEVERSVFLGLAVFRGGFDLDMAREVAGGDVAGDRFIHVFGGLVDKSLVTRERDGSERYRLLQPVREFATRRLRESGGEDDARRRHRDWCVAFSADVEEGVHSPGRHLLLKRLEAEIDNLDVALSQALADEDEAVTAALASAVAWHWANLGSWTRALAALRLASDLSAGNPVRHAELLARLSEVEWFLGDVRQSIRSATTAYELARDLPASPQKVYVLVRLAASYALGVDRDPRRGVELAREAVAVAEASGNRMAMVRSRTVLGSALSWSGEVEEGLSVLGQALEEANESADPIAVINALSSMLTPLYLHPDRRREGPRQLVEDLLERFQLEDWSRYIEYGWIPYVFLQTGEWGRAAASIRAQLGTQRLEGYDRNSHLMTWGTLCWMRGDLAEASEAVAELAAGGVNPRWFHDFYPLCADIAADSGDLEEVRRLAETYLAVEVDPTEEPKKLGVLNPLVRAEVNAAIDTAGTDRADHVSRAEAALDRMIRILDEFPPFVEGSVAMETHGTHLALARAELSRIDGPDRELWKDAADRADYVYFRLYALIRLAGALRASGDPDLADSTLDDARSKAKEIGAAGLVALADRIAAGPS